MRLDALAEAVGEERILHLDLDGPEAWGALAGGLAKLLGDVLDVGWFSVRYWAGTTLVIELAGAQSEHALPDDLDPRPLVEVFARAARGTSARLVLVRTGEGDAVVRFDGVSGIPRVMDLPVRCPVCKASFEARRLWAEDAAKCAYCGADLAVPDVLAAFVDEAMGAPPGEQLEAFPPAEPRAREEEPDDGGLERALADAIDLLAPTDEEPPPRSGDLLTDDVRAMLVRLGVEVPADDAPAEAVERALAEARRRLVRGAPVDRPRPTVQSLVDAVGDIDPEGLVEDELTDPSLYLDEVPPRDDER